MGAAAIAGLVVACTFPDFHVGPGDAPPGNGAAGASQSGRSGSGAIAGSETVEGGRANGGTASTHAGDSGDAGGPNVVDVGPCGQRQYALHCFNHERDDDESDVDCGGSRCPGCAADEACTAASDCSIGSCVGSACSRELELSYRQDNPDPEASSFRLEVFLKYLGDEPILLKDLAVRYYFSRNGVSEPIIPGGSASLSPNDADISSSTTWRVVRQPRGNGISNDAYLEIGFTSTMGKIVSRGAVIDIMAQATSGDSQTLFTQQTHHSFDPDTDEHETKKISVHYKGQRVWGNGPPVDDPPSCLYQGVNLDGPTVAIDGAQWLGSPASLLARYMDTNIELKPSTDIGREEMLRFGFHFNDDQFSYPVENGDYALTVYVWAAGGSQLGRLKVQGEERDAFRCFSFEGGGPWAPLGPYRISIGDGQLTLGAAGSLRAGGFELRRLDE
jgi:hypothetical protein